jgi:hypothetical protein
MVLGNTGELVLDYTTLYPRISQLERYFISNVRDAVYCDIDKESNHITSEEQTFLHILDYM